MNRINLGGMHRNAPRLSSSASIVPALRYVSLLLVLASALVLPAAQAQNKLANQLGSASASSNDPAVADKIVAVVNTDVITRNELRSRVNAVEQSLLRQGTQLPSREVLDRQVLERMILERAQVQFAADSGVRIDDFMLDRTVARIAEQNGMKLPEFRANLEKDGTSFARFREDVRNEIMMNRLRDREVDSKIQISEGEVDNYIAEQSNAPSKAGEYDLAQILLRVPEKATPEQIEKQRARAEDLFKQLEGGADFAKLAASYSDAPEGLKGGDMGWRAPERLPQLFLDAVGKLSSGQIAHPVKSANGFHILKLVGKRAVGPNASLLAPVEQTHVRHILIRVNEVMSSSQARQRLADIKQRIVNKTTTFEEMARAYSNDPSASRGGDLGTIYPGDTVPEFERAMNALAPGEISDPVESPFGWHLIQVIDRKSQEIATDRLRMLARQAIRDRKSDEAYQDWLRQLRDRAYVEYHLDDK